MRTLNYGNYGIFLILGNAGFISSTEGFRAYEPVPINRSHNSSLRGVYSLDWLTGEGQLLQVCRAQFMFFSNLCISPMYPMQALIKPTESETFMFMLLMEEMTCVHFVMLFFETSAT